MKLTPRLQLLYNQIPPSDKARADRMIRRYDNSIRVLDVVCSSFEFLVPRQQRLGDQMYASVTARAIQLCSVESERPEYVQKEKSWQKNIV